MQTWEQEVETEQESPLMVRVCFFVWKTCLCLHMEGACLQTSDEMDRPTPTQTETETEVETETETEAQAETQSESLPCLRRLLAAETSVVGLLVTFNECTEHQLRMMFPEILSRGIDAREQIFCLGSPRTNLLKYDDDVVQVSNV